MFGSALISAAIAFRLLGPGIIYLGQQLRFTRPVKLGDTLKVKLEVLAKMPKNRVRIATREFNQNDERVVNGEAKVLMPRSSEQTASMPAMPQVTIGLATPGRSGFSQAATAARRTFMVCAPSGAHHRRSSLGQPHKRSAAERGIPRRTLCDSHNHF